MHRSIYASAALLLASASPLLAQEEEGKGGLLTLHPGLSIWTLVIFLIVFAVLAKFAFPKILEAVEAREAHLRELAEDAERDRAEAARLAEENRKLVEDTRARVQEALSESRNTAERMKADALEDARRERDEMLARARADIATERELALAAVRRDAVDLAIGAAQKLVRARLDSEENRRLVREFLGEVESPAPIGA